MLGISVYLSDIDQDYLAYAQSLDVKYIFTSLHIKEEMIENIDEKLNELLTLSNDLGMKVIPDISPYTFEKLNLTNNDFEDLSKLGFDMVRLDFGFEKIEDVKMISEYFYLVMNASLVDKTYLDSMKEVGIDLNRVILMHNFYPRKESGLDEAYFTALNKDHQAMNIQTMAFVVGDEKKRLPLFEGLPTLEKHRDVNPYVSGIELMRKHKIDDIFIGDNKAQKHHLKYLADYMKENVLTIPAHLDEAYTYLYDQIIEVRQDISTHIIRLKLDRHEVKTKNNNHRRKGAIVIDNELAQRYSGEVQIIKKTLPFTSRSNNIGWVHPDYVDLLEYIDHTVKLKLIKI